MYGLMEKQPFALEMQKEMIRQMEAARPEYVVQVKSSLSWLQDEDSSTKILTWWIAYSRNYTQTGLVQIVDERVTRYWWGADAADRTPSAEGSIVVYRRKSEVGAL